MYDPASGVEAYIKPWESDEAGDTENQYPEYKAPRGSPFYQPCSRVRYIEAVTNQRFSMVVVLQPQFDFGRQSHVEISYDIDGGSVSTFEVLERSNRTEGKPMKDVASSTLQARDGTLEEIGYVFGELCADKDLDLCTDEEAAEVKKRGKINIKVQRGKAKKRTPRDGDWRTDSLVLPLTTTKTVAVDNGKSHSLKQILLDNDKPLEFAWDFRPARGEPGKPIEFTFCYTSRMILELKRVVPQTTRMSISATSDDNPNSPMPIDEDLAKHKSIDDEEIQLIDKIKIERSDNTSTEPAVAMPSTAPSEAAKFLKATDDPNEQTSSIPTPNDDVTCNRKRRRTREPRDIIDLSDDEEVPSAAKIKIEPVDGIKPLDTIKVSSSASRSVSDVPNIKTESQSQQDVHPGSVAGSAASEVLAANKKQASKAKKRDFLKLQLEKIKIQEQLMELDAEDEE